MSRKNTLIVLAGISGSGKSTFAKYLLDSNPNIAIACPDLVREKLYGDASIQGNGKQVFQMAFDIVELSGKVKADCVFDATNTTKKARKQVIEQGRKYFDFILCYYFTPDLIKSQKQNLNRERQVPLEIIYKQFKKWETPTIEEDFDYVCEIKY
jgi:predicted kinase